MTFRKKIIELWGWTSSLSILLAYGLNTHYNIEEPRILDAMNIYGGIGLAFICFMKKAWQPFTVEAAWAIIAISSLILNSIDDNNDK